MEMRNDMKKIIEILQEELSTAFEKAGYDKDFLLRFSNIKIIHLYGRLMLFM